MFVEVFFRVAHKSAMNNCRKINCFTEKTNSKLSHLHQFSLGQRNFDVKIALTGKIAAGEKLATHVHYKYLINSLISVLGWLRMLLTCKTCFWVFLLNEFALSAIKICAAANCDI